MMTPHQHEVEHVMLDTPTIQNLRHWSKTYSQKAHLAGDLEHAERIRELWCSYGITSELERYDVLQNFPTSTALELRSSTGHILFKATLQEEELPEDPTSLRANGLPAFHGFSANGDVEGKLVYANFGTPDDFENLKGRGIDVKGKIVICKYAKIFRGLEVRAAQQHGAVGVIMYNDPQEDGQYTTKNGYEPFPHGPARHPSSIQRGSVDFFSVAVGDPTTPGYPSLPGGAERRDPHHAIPTIPSLPMSFAEAVPLLTVLNGQGLGPNEMSEETEG
jgi:N-acetylated-alpha-linked acidic dipeptidase